jgi:hypothetical protein
MSRPIITLYEGEKPRIPFEIIKTSDGKPIGDITGATAILKTKRREDNVAIVANAGDLTYVVTGPTAVVTVTFTVAIAVGKAGNYTAQIELQMSGGEIRLTEIFDINCIARV